MLDEQFLHANAEPGGGDKLEKKKRQNVKKLWLEKVELIFKWYWVAAKYVKENVQT